jgi:hypothetical protein
MWHTKRIFYALKPHMEKRKKCKKKLHITIWIYLTIGKHQLPSEWDARFSLHLTTLCYMGCLINECYQWFFDSDSFPPHRLELTVFC